ncbi:hypothetical protein ACFL54_05115 [Planctomycetota bacterium]
MRKTPLFMITVLFVLILGLTVEVSAGRTQAKRNVKGRQAAFNWSKINRNLNIKKTGLKGSIAYAGFLLHRDKNKKPVVTWMAVGLDKSSKYSRLFIDTNNDHILTTNEEFQPKEKDKSSASKSILFVFDEIEIGGKKHTKFNMNITLNDPFGGFYFSLSLEGDPKRIMRCSYHQTESRAPYMGRRMKDAPVYDFLIVDGIDISAKKVSLPLNGLGYISTYLTTRGSADKSTSHLDMQVIAKNNVEFKITYPIKGNRTKTISELCNKVC